MTHNMFSCRNKKNMNSSWLKTILIGQSTFFFFKFTGDLLKCCCWEVGIKITIKMLLGGRNKNNNKNVKKKTLGG